MFAYDGVSLRFEAPALVEIAEQAIARETGARGLRSIMEHILRKTMFEIPSADDVVECLIDADVVKGISEVKQIRNEPKQRRQSAL